MNDKIDLFESFWGSNKVIEILSNADAIKLSKFFERKLTRIFF